MPKKKITAAGTVIDFHNIPFSFVFFD